MEEARDVFSDEPQHGLPDDVQNLCHRIDKDAVLVAEPIVRDAMFAVVSALWHATDLLPETFQTTPKSISRLCAAEGRDLLGDMLRGEMAQELPRHLKAAEAAVRQVHEFGAQVDPSAFEGWAHDPSRADES
jgi:hypothetical protein